MILMPRKYQKAKNINTGNTWMNQTKKLKIVKINFKIH